MLERLLSFPVVLTTAPFLLLMVLLVLSLLTGWLDDPGADVDVGPEGGSLGPLLPAGFARYPLIVTLTLTTFFATVLLYYAEFGLSSLTDGWLHAVLGLVAVMVTLFAGLHLAALALRPLAPLFDRSRAFAKIDYRGRRARVRSQSLGPDFGQIVVTEDGMENQLDAFCDPGVELGYGDAVIVVGLDTERGSYRVIPAPERDDRSV